MIQEIKQYVDRFYFFVLVPKRFPVLLAALNGKKKHMKLTQLQPTLS